MQLGINILGGGQPTLSLHISGIFEKKIQSFCAHLTGNFLNFPKLTLLLPVVYFQGVLWTFKDKSPFFWGHPVYLNLNCKRLWPFFLCVCHVLQLAQVGQGERAVLGLWLTFIILLLPPDVKYIRSTKLQVRVQLEDMQKLHRSP